MVKNPFAMRETGRLEFDPWVGKIPWRRAWQPTPLFLPGESHGQRSLVGYSQQGCKESDKTEQLTLSLSGIKYGASQVALVVKNLLSNVGDVKCGFDC